MIRRLEVFLAACALLAGRGALAGYDVALSRVPADAGAVRPGEVFEVAVDLRAASQERNNSAVVRIEVDKAGLEYLSYAWAAPYLAGTADDDSKPRLPALPRRLDEAALSAPGYPPGVVDLELSNLADFSSGPSFFRSGRLATLRLQVPAIFSAGGAVVFRLRSAEFADGFTPAPASLGPPLAVWVEAAGSSYASWAAVHFGGTAGPGAPAMDPDGDWRSNLQEYAFGTNPAIPQQGGAVSATAAAPGWVLEFGRPKGAADLTHRLELSGNLSAWRLGVLGEDYAEEPALDLGGGLERVRWRPITGEGPVFFRVRAELATP